MLQLVTPEFQRLALDPGGEAQLTAVAALQAAITAAMTAALPQVTITPE